MNLVYARCAGLDVHKKTVVAGVRVPGPEPGERRGGGQTFPTTMAGRTAPADSLTAPAATHLAMEPPRVYWRPVSAGLEGVMTLLLPTARHGTMVPGRTSA